MAVPVVVIVAICLITDVSKLFLLRYHSHNNAISMLCIHLLHQLQKVTTAATSAVKVVAGLETASDKLVPLLDKKDRILATLARLICSSGDAVQRFLPNYPGTVTCLHCARADISL
jgi:hypothetical protein